MYNVYIIFLGKLFFPKEQKGKEMTGKECLKPFMAFMGDTPMNAAQAILDWIKDAKLQNCTTMSRFLDNYTGSKDQAEECLGHLVPTTKVMQDVIHVITDHMQWNECTYNGDTQIATLLEKIAKEGIP